MICTQFYEGQGLGNQLWAYVTLRVIAEKKSLPFGVVNPQYFKGFPFLDLDFGEFVELPPNSDPNDVSVLPLGIKHLFVEQQEYDAVSGLDITSKSYDLDLISDSTKIQGNFQNHEFIAPFKSRIREWLKPITPKYYSGIDNEACIINFRGGEYRHWKAIFLDKHYWHRARKLMTETIPGVKFRVITDDPELAKYFFPADEIVNGGIAEDFLAIYNAKYLIISNSSFAWFPAWINENVEICIAPKFWAGYKLNRFWSCEYTINQEFIYLNSLGEIWNLENAKIRNELRELLECKFGNSKIRSRFYRNSDLLAIRNLRWLPRRRRSRIHIWLQILFAKAIGTKSLAAISNVKTELTRNTNYSWRQYPLFKKRNRLVSTEPVLDCFLFMDELEVLKLRLKILSPYVDKFIVVESRHTFTGLEKPLNLSENLHLFEEYKTALHIVILDFEFFTRSDFYSAFYNSNLDSNIRLICARTLTAPNVPRGESPWLREFFNKEFIALAMAEYSPKCRAVVSDVDEIWNPKWAPNKLPSEGIFIYKQLPFVFFMNNLSSESWGNWCGSVTSSVGNFVRIGINRSRTHHLLPRRVIHSGGWHFSFQGGAKSVLSKLNAYGHQELNTQTNRDAIAQNRYAVRDIRGIKANFKKNETLLPPEALELKARLPDWFL